jgi:hypothetical protein
VLKVKLLLRHGLGRDDMAHSVPLHSIRNPNFHVMGLQTPHVRAAMPIAGNMFELILRHDGPGDDMFVHPVQMPGSGAGVMGNGDLGKSGRRGMINRISRKLKKS